VFPDGPSGPKAAENIAIIDSIRAAIADGCQVVNVSIEGSGTRNDGVRTAIADAWATGVLCIAAAGNGFGNPVSFPAVLEHCVAGTAIGREGAFPDAPKDLIARCRGSAGRARVRLGERTHRYPP
jgi:hypothetical protein